MDIGSKRGYPASSLSNFSPHEFTIDGVKCASMEGFLQSLKFSSIEMQKHICTLVGIKAKRAGGKEKLETKPNIILAGKRVCSKFTRISKFT